MKVATKVATGSGLLAALLIGVLVYFVLLVRQLVAVNHQLTEVHFRTTTVALELLGQLDQLELDTRKFFVTRDTRYADLVTDARTAFATGLAELERLAARGADTEGIRRLVALWRAFPLATVPKDNMAARLTATSDAELLEAVAAPLDDLHRQTLAVLAASREGIARQVAATGAAGREVERFSLAVAAVAPLLAALIVALSVRSIREPLRRLTEGTRAVASGTFTYQLEATEGDEFASLAEDFNTMVRRLDELDTAKRGFVSHVSHELKTPLVAMQETNRLLLDGLPGPLTDRQRRLLELNLQGSRRLSAMIANLLDLARLEAGVMSYDVRQHDVTALARSATGELEALATERGVGFVLDAPEQPVVAECDADRVVQVLENLLDNAVKFSPPGASVTVVVRSGALLPTDAPSDSDVAPPPYALVRVRDSGPGIPDREKVHVFEKFHQAAKGSRRAGAGVGLGLAISGEIVRAHGGVTWVADNHPSGTITSLVLPIRAPHRGGGRARTVPEGGKA
jgi:signal transduction histidine kinase